MILPAATGSHPKMKTIWIHITTGTHAAQICWFPLAEARYPRRDWRKPPAAEKTSPINSPGGVTIIDLDLSRYNAIASRFACEREERRLTFGNPVSRPVTRASNRRSRELLSASLSASPILLERPHRRR